MNVVNDAFVNIFNKWFSLDGPKKLSGSLKTT